MLARNGITSAVDARVYWGRGHEQAWADLERQGKLTIKAVLSMWIYPDATNDDAQIAALKTHYERGNSSLLSSSY